MMGMGSNEYGRDGLLLNNIIYNGGFYNQIGIPEESIKYNNNGMWDPLFIDAANGDYRLSNSSPSKNAGQYGVSQGYEHYYNLSDLVYYPEHINYSWNNGDSIQEIYVNPSTTTNYNLIVSDGLQSCSTSTSQTSTISPAPYFFAYLSARRICPRSKAISTVPCPAGVVTFISK